MKFIKKKNLQRGEELLYVPQLHWMYTVKHILLSLPFFLILCILWGTAQSIAASSIWLAVWGAGFIQLVIKHIFMAALVVVLLIFVCRVLLYLSTEYGLTNKRLIIKKGIIRVQITEIPTDRIESIYCVQGLLGRLCHYATVYISGIGGTIPAFFMVHRPYALRRKIAEIIEKNKTITVIHGDMPWTRPPVKPKPVEKEPMYRYGTFVRILPNK